MNPVVVTVDYGDGRKLFMESVGPSTALGMVDDYVQDFWTESPNGHQVESIMIKRMTAEEVFANENN